MRLMTGPRTLALWLAVLCVGLMVTTRPSLGQELTASIIGTVTDESGLVLPGVTVVATSPALQIPSVLSVSDARGEYRLAPLPIGTYLVRWELPGFRSVEQIGVRLTVGFVATIPVSMSIGALEESITVSGESPVVDVTSAGSRTDFTREALEELPTTRNGMLSVLIQAPGVRPVATQLDVGGSQFATITSFNNFGRSGDQWTLNDGMLTLSGNGTAEGVYWDFSTYEEIGISTFANTAEMPGSGVMLNSIIKSGGNEFHGGGTFTFSGPALEGSNIGDALAAQGVTGGNALLKRFDGNVELGGRLVRDKLWFYVSTRRAENDVEIVGVFKEDGTPGNLPRVQQFFTSKVSYQVTPTNKFTFLFQDNAKDNIFSISALNAWESRLVQKLTGFMNKLQWQGTAGNTIAYSAHFGYYRYDSPLFPQTTSIGTLDLGSRERTGASSTGVDADQWRSHTHFELTAYQADLFAGNHEFKFGFDYTPAAHDWAYWDLADPPPSISSTPFGRNYSLTFRDGVPNQIGTINNPVHPISRADYTGAYVQDQWVAGRLSMSLGLRFDRNNGYVPAQSRPGGPFATQEDFPRVQFAIWNSFAPRLQFAYDLSGTGRTALKGGWARFNGLRFTNEIRGANQNDHITTVYSWNDLNGDLFWDPTQVGEVDLDPNGPDFVRSRGTGGAPRVPNPDELQPTIDELSVSLEHELLPGLSVRVSGVHTRENNLRRLVGVDRPPESYNIPVTGPDPGPDGTVGTTDDPGTMVTYFEFPESLRGADFERIMPVTVPDLTNQYSALEFSVQKRLTSNFQLRGTYGFTWIDQPLGGDLRPFTPNAEINAERNYTDWYAKLGGSYRFEALDLLTSANLTGVSGNPYGRTALFRGGNTISSIVLPTEAYDSRRRDAVFLLDLRLQKDLRLPSGHTVSVRADLYNALNTNAVTGLSIQSGRNFQRVTGIIPPRIMVFGVEYNF
jgi:hypothetical protein